MLWDFIFQEALSGEWDKLLVIIRFAVDDRTIQTGGNHVKSSSLKKAILSLDTLPQSYQERNEGRYAGKGYRQLLIDNYIAIFRIDESCKVVYVVTIQYQGRNL